MNASVSAHLLSRPVGRRATGLPAPSPVAEGAVKAVSALLVAQAYLATSDRVHRSPSLPPCPVAMLDTAGFPRVVDGRPVWVDSADEASSIAALMDEVWDKGVFALIRCLRNGGVVVTTLVEYGGARGTVWEQVFPRPDGGWYLLDDEGLEVAVALDEARPCWLFQVSPK